MLLTDNDFWAIIDPNDNDEEDDEDDEEEEEDEEDECVDDAFTSFTNLGRTNFEFVAKSFTDFLTRGIYWLPLLVSISNSKTTVKYGIKLIELWIGNSMKWKLHDVPVEMSHYFL